VGNDEVAIVTPVLVSAADGDHFELEDQVGIDEP
jgi:hypothetical protein